MEVTTKETETVHSRTFRLTEPHVIQELLVDRSVR
ncbi:MAG: hypothetical protein K0R28_1880, partial [Paenibacillus sp.]|nr:hypothetical protein [Paenibacillus sp.]